MSEYFNIVSVSSELLHGHCADRIYCSSSKNTITLVNIEMGILDPFSCGLLKSLYATFCAKIFQNFKGKAKRHIHKGCSVSNFPCIMIFFATNTGTRFKVEYKTFVNNFTKTKDHINTLNKRHRDERK